MAKAFKPRSKRRSSGSWWLFLRRDSNTKHCGDAGAWGHRPSVPGTPARRGGARTPPAFPQRPEPPPRPPPARPPPRGRGLPRRKPSRCRNRRQGKQEREAHGEAHLSLAAPVSASHGAAWPCRPLLPSAMTRLMRSFMSPISTVCPTKSFWSRLAAPREPGPARKSSADWKSDMAPSRQWNRTGREEMEAERDGVGRLRRGTESRGESPSACSTLSSGARPSAPGGFRERCVTYALLVPPAAARPGAAPPRGRSSGCRPVPALLRSRSVPSPVPALAHALARAPAGRGGRAKLAFPPCPRPFPPGRAAIPQAAMCFHTCN